jgi:hypothetical protein
MPKSNTRGCGHTCFKVGLKEVFFQMINYVSEIASQYSYYCNHDFSFLIVSIDPLPRHTIVIDNKINYGQ